MQEEDEEPARGSGIAKMLELSVCSQGDSSHGDGEESETSRLRVSLDDLQAQNTMLQDELTLLSNVKSELEAELERAKEEFQMEKEELEFKINELQMTKDNPNPAEPLITLDPEQQEVPEESKRLVTSPAQDQDSLNPEEEQNLNLNLRSQCDAFTGEQDSALAECQHMREILQCVEAELGEKPKDGVSLYKAIKEQGAKAVQDLQDKLEQLNKERDELLTKMREATEEKNNLMETVEGLKLKLDIQELPSCDLKKSVEDLTRHNEEILSQLGMKENMTQDLKEMVTTLTEERDKIQNLLKLREEEVHKLNDEKAREIGKLLEEKDREALLLRDKREKELRSLKLETEKEVQHIKEEREKMERCLKDELGQCEKMVCDLELTVKELSLEKAELQEKLNEAFSGLSKAQEDRKLLSSKLATIETQLEQEMSEKQHLQAKVNSLIEEAEQACASIRGLEEVRSEELKKSAEDIKDLQTRIEELEKERNLLRSSLEETQAERKLEEVQQEFQTRIKDLEQEKNMLRTNMEEVVKDAEGLQRDLQDMKSVNEKISEENQKLQAQISLMTKDEEEEEEEVSKLQNMEKECKELRDQLTDQESLILQMRSEMAALQVCACFLSVIAIGLVMMVVLNKKQH